MNLAAKTPTSIFVKPLALMAQLVASSATFQDLVDAANEDEALAHVHYPMASDQRDDDTQQMVHPRPRAIVDWGGDYSYWMEGTREWKDTGLVSLSFEFPVLSEDDGGMKDEAIEFGNKIGAIIEEMGVNSGLNTADGSGTYVNLRRFDLAQPPATVTDGADVFMGVVFSARWTG